MENLGNIIESILFISGDGIELFDIADKLQIELKEVETAVKELKEKHKNDGIQVITYNKKVQLCSNPENAEFVTEVLNPIKERELTKRVLEVAAIIAYKQPITRLEIENIRGGASSDYGITTLLDNNMIEVVGRKDAVGKPLLFGTTDTFLKRFGLNSIDELPDYEELLSRIQVIKAPEGNGLFNYEDYSEKFEQEEQAKAESTKDIEEEFAQDNELAEEQTADVIETEEDAIKAFEELSNLAEDEDFDFGDEDDFEDFDDDDEF